MPVKISRRQDIRAFLTQYFNLTQHEVSVEECLDAYITSRQLGIKYLLKSNEKKTNTNTSSQQRLQLRNQVSQELNVMKQMGLIGRARYGFYVKKITS